MSSPFRTKQFKDLRAHWYQKLTESGFEDIEDVNSPLEYLKKWDNSYFRNRHSVQCFVETQEYYLVASTFFHDYELSPFQRIIWDMHCDGEPLRAIAEHLNNHGYKTNKDAVNVIVAGLSALVRESFK